MLFFSIRGVCVCFCVYSCLCVCIWSCSPPWILFFKDCSLCILRQKSLIGLRESRLGYASQPVRPKDALVMTSMSHHAQLLTWRIEIEVRFSCLQWLSHYPKLFLLTSSLPLLPTIPLFSLETPKARVLFFRSLQKPWNPYCLLPILTDMCTSAEIGRIWLKLLALPLSSLGNRAWNPCWAVCRPLDTK